MKDYLITVEEASQMLGVDLAFVNEAVRNKKLLTVCENGNVLVEKEDFRAWLKSSDFKKEKPKPRFRQDIYTSQTI